MRLLSPVAAAVLLLSARGTFAQIVIVGDTADANITSVGGTASTGSPARSGYGASPPRAFSYVIPFLLPNLSGQTVQSATFAVHLSALPVAATTYNMDVYGLNARATPAVPGDVTMTGLPAPDHYNGTFGGDTSDAFPLHDDLLVPTAAIGTVTTSGGVGTGAITLVDYLNLQYTAFGAGNYVFLRFSPDFVPVPPTTGAPTSGYLFNSADDTTASFRPTLTITTAAVPEPAPLALTAVGLAVAAVARRRGRHRLDPPAAIHAPSA